MIVCNQNSVWSPLGKKMSNSVQKTYLPLTLCYKAPPISHLSNSPKHSIQISKTWQIYLFQHFCKQFLETLTQISIQEIGLTWGSEDELDNLKSTFETIQLLLQDAEMKQRKSLTLQNWLRKLKNAAYDADNILDQIATEGLRQKVDSERGNHHKLKAFISQRNPLLFRNKIARKVQDVRQRLDVVLEEGSKLGLTSMAIMDNQNGDALDDRKTSSLVNESEIYGRDEEKKVVVETLLNYMSNRDDLSVYAICGMGGIGKTTLAQLVYNDERVDNHFEMRIWVCVSVDFSLPRLVRAILESIEGGGCNISELDPLMRRLQEKLKGRKFLMVLDDVWSDDDVQWDKLKEALRCGSNGSVLLVTTRIEKVALMMAASDTHHLRYLSEEESMSLFRKRAFAAGEADKNLEKIGKEIVRKCGGVPLAVKALGSLMRYKSSESEWLAIQQSEMWNLSDGDNGILPALRLSYDNLSPQMRQCFAYCCIFPKDEVMKVNKLIKLWMANGFIQCKGQTDMRLASHLIFKELVWKSFFQEVQINHKGKMVCKIHDLMHDLAESVMRNETHKLKVGDDLKIPKGVRHLSILGSYNIWGDTDKLKSPTGRSLRSIILQRTNLPQGFSSFISKQKELRVLDLSITSLSPYPIHKMENLRYLVIACYNLKKIPESITCLLNLQTLKLRDSCRLLELPKSLRYMKSLYFLHIDNYTSLLCTPPGLGELTCLQRLSIFIVGRDSAHGIGQLKDLNLGGKLCVKGLGCIRDLNDAKSANLVSKKNLTCLSLFWEKKDIEQNSAEHYEEVLEGLQPNQNLEEINISMYQGSKFPNWMSALSFNNLLRITLDNCYRCERLPPLGKLPSLTFLKLFCMDSVKRLDGEWHGINNGESGSFPALKELYIEEMPNLEEWKIPDTIESFPCLETLRVEECPKLKELPFLANLKTLYLKKVHTAVVRSVMFLTSLTELKLRYFSELDVLLEGLRNDKAEIVQPLSNLRKLEICLCEGLCSLPNWLGSLQSLSEMVIAICRDLNSLPDDMQNLKSLTRLVRTGPKYLTSLKLSLNSMLNNEIWTLFISSDELMEVDELIALWMANGFIQCKGQTDMRLAGHLIFKELVWKSFFQEVQINHKGKMVCKIHDLMHDLAESVMRNETHKLEVGDDLKIPKGVRHLSILGLYNFWGDTDKLKSPTGRSLRSIILQRTNLPQGFSSFISKQKELRVLDLSITSLSPYPIHKMEHLRYLVISCKNLKKLPESIACLQNLQTLKLTYSYSLLELPKGLRYMRSLYFLHIDDYKSLLCTPPGLGELTCLQKLSIFIVGQDSAHGIGQLKDLNLGGKLFIKGLGCIRDLNDSKSANLVSKKNLTCLRLSWEKGIEQNSAEHYEQVLEGLQPNKNLEEISISKYQSSMFPNWMSTLSFNNLSRFTLDNCYRCERLPPLGKLPCLTYLGLFRMDSVKRLDGEWHGINNGESCSFPALKELSIEGMPNLEEWKLIPDTIVSFPCIERLAVFECPKLKELPFLANLRSLRLGKVHTAVVRSVMFLTSLTELQLWYFSELDVLLEGLRNDKAEIVQPLSNLRRLEIWYCKGLCSLPNWLGSLQSLSEMAIGWCPDLNSLPDDMQNLKSLKTLRISHCPVLGKRCENPNGEDWPKISHIPEIIIK